VLYPASKFTKAEVIEYYVRVVPNILPHLKDCPVTLKRYPDGVMSEAHWEKDAPNFTPKWLETFRVPRHTGGPAINYILIQNTATLAWAVNAAAVELIRSFIARPRLSYVDRVRRRSGRRSLSSACIRVALEIKACMEHLGLKLFPKVSGSKGLQLYIPLNRPSSYDIARPFARSIGQWIEGQHPKLLISEMPKEKRVGKVFIDWSQNADYKTIVGVYLLRAKQQHPFVSMPVKWDKLSDVLKRKKIDHPYFEPEICSRSARRDRRPVRGCS
jgi:bifunctional non-homologous end joining protein LigD